MIEWKIGKVGPSPNIKVSYKWEKDMCKITRWSILLPQKTILTSHKLFQYQVSCKYHLPRMVFKPPAPVRHSTNWAFTTILCFNWLTVVTYIKL